MSAHGKGGSQRWQEAVSSTWALEPDHWVQVLALTLTGPWTAYFIFFSFTWVYLTNLGQIINLSVFQSPSLQNGHYSSTFLQG